MNIVDNLHSITDSFSVISHLKKNERLRVKREKFAKLSSPISAHMHKFFIFVAIQSIIDTLRKAVQALGRKWTRQSTDHNIKKIEGIVDKCFAILEKLKKPIDENEFYEVLRELQTVQVFVENSIKADGGLKNYQATCLSDNACFKRSKQKVRKEREQKLQKIIDLTKELSEKLNIQVNAMKSDSNVIENDSNTCKTIIADIFANRSIQETQVLQSAAREVLVNIFGESAVSHVFKTYEYESNIVLSSTDLHMILFAIVANLTTEDLKGVFNNKDNPILNLNTEDFPENFDDLSQEQLCHLLEKIRDLDLSRFKMNVPKISGRYSNQFKRDLEILKTMKLLSEYEKANDEVGLRINHMKHFGYSEYLSRDVIYALCLSSKTRFRDGVLIPILDNELKKKCLKGYSLHHSKGLYGVTFLPTSPESHEVRIVFRGTYDRDSVNRDISFREKEYYFGFEGPGRRSFNKRQKKILKKLGKHLKMLNRDDSYAINLMGHSLGGSDAQRMCHAITKKLYDQSFPLNLNQLELNVYNSPAIEEKVSKEFLNAVDELKDVEFSLRYFDTKNDIIQKSGGVRLGFSENEKNIPNNLHLSIMTFTRTTKLNDELRQKIVQLGISSRMIKGPMGKLLLNLVRRMDAHSKHLFWTHDDDRRNIYNGTYIVKIYTTHEEDRQLKYGPNNRCDVELSHLMAIFEKLKGIGKHTEYKLQKMFSRPKPKPTGCI